MISDTLKSMIDALDSAGLMEAKHEVDKRIGEMKLNKIIELADEMLAWGISADDLYGRSKESKALIKLPMKYVHPDDASQQWSGKGKPPNWFKECLAKGMTRTDLEISSPLNVMRKTWANATRTD